MMNKCNMSLIDDSRSNKIWQLHLEILKGILGQKPFELLVEENYDIIRKLGYIDILTRSGNLNVNKNTELIAAYPLSPIRTDYFVEVDGLGTGYAMCAIDALGVAFILSKKTKIFAKDNSTGKDIFIEIDPKHLENVNPKLFTSYIKVDKTMENPAVQQCPQIKFYSSENDIIKTTDIEILNFSQAINHAKQRFSPQTFIDSIKLCIEDSNYIVVG